METEGQRLLVAVEMETEGQQLLVAVEEIIRDFRELKEGWLQDPDFYPWDLDPERRLARIYETEIRRREFMHQWRLFASPIPDPVKVDLERRIAELGEAKPWQEQLEALEIEAQQLFDEAEYIIDEFGELDELWQAAVAEQAAHRRGTQTLPLNDTMGDCFRQWYWSRAEFWQLGTAVAEQAAPRTTTQTLRLTDMTRDCIRHWDTIRKKTEDFICDLDFISYMLAAQINLVLQERLTEITELRLIWRQRVSQIDRGEITAIPISSEHISDSASNTSTCPICLDDFEMGEAGGQLHCGHLYHQECISMWLTSDNTCPTCRRVVPRIVPLIEE